MSEILIVTAITVLAVLLIGGLIDRRRRRSFEEYRRRHLERKAQVERDARSRL